MFSMLIVRGANFRNALKDAGFKLANVLFGWKTHCNKNKITNGNMNRYFMDGKKVQLHNWYSDRKQHDNWIQ
jgi:hypothetical protein